MNYPNIQPIVPLSNPAPDPFALPGVTVNLEPDPIANIVNDHCTNCGEFLEEGEAAVEYCPNCCYKIVQLNGKSIYEAFKLWDEEVSKDTCGGMCAYAKATGGPGFYTELYECEAHPEIGYRTGHCCPNNCTDFKLKSDMSRFGVFMHSYHQHPSYYNQKYNIDRETKGFMKGYKPNPYSFNL